MIAQRWPVQPGQRALYRPFTSIYGELVGGYFGGAMNYTGQELAQGKDLSNLTLGKIHHEAIKNALQSTLTGVKWGESIKTVRETPVLEQTNLGSHAQGSVVIPESYVPNVITNGDMRTSPVTNQRIYSLAGEYRGVKGEYRVVLEPVGVDWNVRRAYFVPKKVGGAGEKGF